MNEKTIKENYDNFTKNKSISPKATAMWLIDNTALTFLQIAKFCNLDILEVNAMANGEFSSIKGINPIENKQLTKEEIERCTANPEDFLKYFGKEELDFLNKRRMTRYISRKKRKDKPDSILWFLKHYPDFDVNDICRLINTTKNLVLSIQNKTHWNYENLELKNPVDLGFCAQEEIDNLQIRKDIVNAREKNIKLFENQ